MQPLDLEVIIGLEIHAQLNTASKLFCGCDNDAFGAEPNTRVCPVCMGFPGMLPVLNARALEKGLQVGAALGCQLQPYSKFDRKNYFYPDLPCGYQISQYDEPIAEHGHLSYPVDEQTVQSAGITRVHLEMDAGKLTHTASKTLCDYNRSGTPLVEIVTEPDLRSATEAREFAKMVQRTLRATGASDADMEKGMMRFDASVSLRPRGDEQLYPRAEIKNLNSFTSLYKALQYEVMRQRQLWEAGTPPTQEITVGWRDEEERTHLLREKESATDYRYFPEPDLPPITLSQEAIAAVESTLPMLPMAVYTRLRAEHIPHEEALSIIDDPRTGDFLSAAVAAGAPYKKAVNVLLSVLGAHADWQDSLVTPAQVADGIALVEAGRLSSSGLRQVLEAAMTTPGSAEKIMQQLGVELSQDTGQLEAWVQEALDGNPQSVADYREGKEKALQYLVGQVMQRSRGQANPPQVMQLLREKLG